MLQWPTTQEILEMLSEVLKPHIAAHPNIASRLEEIALYLSNTTTKHYKPEILEALSDAFLRQLLTQGIWNLLDPRGRGVVTVFIAALLHLTKSQDVFEHIPEGLYLAGLVPAVGMGLLGPATFISFPASLMHALNEIGFSTTDPVAGSPAAGLQSLAYGGKIDVGSAFSLVQKAIMGNAAQAMTMGSQLLKKDRAKL